jgi:hypothetical protein
VAGPLVQPRPHGPGRLSCTRILRVNQGARWLHGGGVVLLTVAFCVPVSLCCQVCDIVVESPDPHIACRRVLDAALYEWEERMSADNITVLVVEFEWGEDASTASVASLERTVSGR